MIIIVNKQLLNTDAFKAKRLIPMGLEGVGFSLVFDSGFKPIDRYPPFVNLTDNTGKNYKRDIYGYGSLLEFDGVNERISINAALNPVLNVDPDVKFTWFSRFKILNGVNGDILFGRSPNAPNPSKIYIGVDSGNIIVFMKEDSGITYSIGIPLDTEWHNCFFGFDGLTWFIEFDGIRSTNGVNTHLGFTGGTAWGIGAKNTGQNSCNCQITELGLIKNNSL